MDNAGVGLFQDEKPKVFAPQGYSDGAREVSLILQFPRSQGDGGGYHAIRSSRFTGVLLTSGGIYVTYNSSAALMKWRYKSEMRVKALMWSVLCQQRLTGQYNAMTLCRGFVLGESMELCLPNADQPLAAPNMTISCWTEATIHFFFFTNDHQGEVLLALLCDCAKTAQLNDILKQGLTTRATSRPSNTMPLKRMERLFCFATSSICPGLRASTAPSILWIVPERSFALIFR